MSAFWLLTRRPPRWHPRGRGPSFGGTVRHRQARIWLRTVTELTHESLYTCRQICGTRDWAATGPRPWSTRP
eukprot:scaffold966_cov415-Prasinococcus_capsulatus_cf.AAC.1